MDSFLTFTTQTLHDIDTLLIRIGGVVLHISETATLAVFIVLFVLWLLRHHHAGQLARLRKKFQKSKKSFRRTAKRRRFSRRR
jgi:hypothetical protein